ncbi:MAG: 2-oxoacid:acceptor oxidoreductase family protein [Nanoarchaeota archaeon]|nr:2-oxoacid:acceptor oxidoreductase family protein [Nanoarchaeota archaeon]
MEEKIIIAGFGGQGVILAGNALAQSALAEDKEITAMVSYGAEMRGGTATCSITISDNKIASPVVDEPTTLIALNRPSLDKYEGSVAKNGLIVLNESLADRDVKRKDVKVVKVPATEIANELGNVRVANVILLGAFIKKTGILDLDKVVKTLPKSFPKHKQDLADINIKALKKGAELV